MGMKQTVLLLAVVTGASGCATMNPYVQHSRNVSGDNTKACKGDHGGDEPALKYACEMVIRMEKARAEIVTTRSTLTATVFPLVGIVGYNSARGINGATNAALTAGGFAGYSAVTTLAQPDRIRVYDTGIRSLTCAIGTYEIGAASGHRESAGRLAAKNAAVDLEALIRVALEKSKGSSEELYAKLYAVEGIRDWLATSGPNRSFAAQLMKFTRETVADVNSQLTLTVPDNKQLIGDAFSTLQSGVGTPANGLEIPKAQAGSLKAFGVAPAVSDEITSKFNALVDMYRLIAREESTINSTLLDFRSCSYADISDIGVKDGIGRFMLGPGDSLAGARVTWARGTSHDVSISGGIPPYVASVDLETATGKMSADVKDGLMKVSIPADDPGGIYRIRVNDVTNRYFKSLWVEVPPP